VPAAHAQWSSRGFVAVEGRSFQPDEIDDTADGGLGLSGRLELTHRHKPWKEKLRVFGRFDMLDFDRNLVILEEGWLGVRTKWIRAGVGAQLLNWTATEAFHPADVINSRNLDSNLENLEKLGEPVVQFGVRFFDGEIIAYYMPLRLAPIFPGAKSRLSFAPRASALGPLTIDLDALWVDRDGAISTDMVSHQWAVSISQTFGELDIALQAVQHNDRSQPTFRLDTQSLSLRPMYSMVTHLGMTAVYTPDALEGFVFKLEAAHRMFDEADPSPRYAAPPGELSAPADHTQVAFGLEYGWEWEDKGWDSTLLLEGQAVILNDSDEVVRRRMHIFQRDVLLGYRHVFNDIDSREFLVGWIVDLERWPEMMLNMSYRQRVTDTWSVEGAVRFVHAPGDDDPEAGIFPTGLEALHESNSISLTVKRNF